MAVVHAEEAHVRGFERRGVNVRRVGPRLAVEIRQHAPPPFRRSHRLIAVDRDVHHGPRAVLELADFAQGHVVGETRDADTVRDEPGKGGVRRARQQEEHARRQRQDSQGDPYRQQRQAGVKVLQAAARGGGGFADGPANFSAGQRRDGEDQVQRQAQEEVEVDRQDGRRQQLQKRDDGDVEGIAMRPGGENFRHRQKEDQVHGGGEQAARQEKIIKREKRGVPQGRQGRGAFRQAQPHPAAEQQGAQQKTGAGERHSGCVQIGRARNGQVAAGHQAQKRELEETFDREGTGNDNTPPGAGVRTRHKTILPGGSARNGYMPPPALRLPRLRGSCSACRSQPAAHRMAAT